MMPLYDPLIYLFNLYLNYTLWLRFQNNDLVKYSISLGNFKGLMIRLENIFSKIQWKSDDNLLRNHGKLYVWFS